MTNMPPPSLPNSEIDQVFGRFISNQMSEDSVVEDKTFEMLMEPEDPSDAANPHRQSWLVPPPQKTGFGPDDHHHHHPQSGENDSNETAGQNDDEVQAPWTVDWKEKSSVDIQKALTDFKDHAKELFKAIVAFVDESNEVYKEWSIIQEAETKETQRLNEVEPDVYQATRCEDMYGEEASPAENDQSES